MPGQVYRQWLRASELENTPASLEMYIAEGARAEGWTSEVKAAAHDADYGVREAVASLHNARGGEVLVGVSDVGRVDGSAVRLEAMNETLRQARAIPAPWRITDLLQVTGNTTKVDLPDLLRWAYVLEVRPTDLPAFVLDRNDRLVLPVRSGTDTMVLDSASAIEWHARRRRAEVLRSCYREMTTFALQLSQHRPLPEGLPDPLPYIHSIIQDGTAYIVLTPKDRAILFGAGNDSGRVAGVVDVYYQTVRKVRSYLAGIPPSYSSLPIRDLTLIAFEFANLESERSQAIRQLGEHIHREGFVLDPGPPSAEES